MRLKLGLMVPSRWEPQLMFLFSAATVLLSHEITLVVCTSV